MDTANLAAELPELAVALVTTWGLRLVGAVAVLLAGLAVARTARASVRRALERSRVDATLVPFLSGLAYYLVATIVGIAILGLFGIQTASIIAVLGAAGLAVGLALQGTLSNFASGVMLLIFRPFGVGDYVEAGGAAGTVEEVGVFATRLNTPDNVRLVVPNAAIYDGIVKNYSHNDTRRNDMVVGVSYDDDLATALSTIDAVLEADPRVLGEPSAQIAVAELGDSSVNIAVRPWCRKEDYWALRFDLTRALKERLEAAGCSIPYPQRDVHVHQAGRGAAA